ncbi:AI-2E family transporter [Adhaeretor mobilis]|uniref:Putative inner membrane protein n=1 Tax=Adhaeretor mobilis TaxID=1930276 RepID=A0A517MVM7_9BACT|nr:AI-2E family transporter [Adhaeretor mobilis]QDS98930.1 putative inner membrane protein [Adhaeretor mobilis]
MPRVVSFIVLVAILLLIGSMFFRVMLQFVVPLFLASVLVVVFKPLHEWIQKRLPGKPKVAALATTAVILVSVLGPATWLGMNSYREFNDQWGFLIERDHEAPEATKQRNELIAMLEERGGHLLDWYKETLGQPLDTKKLLPQVSFWGLGTITSGLHLVISLLFGVAIMVLALYYFLVDGDAMIETLMRLSPLDDDYERELLDKFANVSRAVVLASLLSAVAQGILAGIGYYFVLDTDAPVFLLTAATMALAIVPFVGAAAVWLPTCLWLYFIDERLGAAVGLGIYGAAIVSSADNLVKPYVLHGQSNLHPLLALLSVLGGVQVLGPIGILVGPMLVAFIQALLNMLNKELRLMSNEPNKQESEYLAANPAVAVQAEAAAFEADALLGSLGRNKHETKKEPDQATGTQQPPAKQVPKGKKKRRGKK